MSNLLDRRLSNAGLGESSFHLDQRQLEQDQLLEGFRHEASNWKNLAAMTAGGLAYRLGNSVYLSVLPSQLSFAGTLAPVFGLATEVSAFRGVNQILSPHPSAPTPHSSWFTDYVNFGSLKFFGKLAQNQNLVFAHFLQDAGMVAGHQITYGLGLSTAPEGSLVKQFLHAESTNLALAAGNSLAHQLTNGKILLLEKSLELRSGAIQKELKAVYSRRPLLEMRADDHRSPYSEIISERRNKISKHNLEEAKARLETHWQKWSANKILEKGQGERLEKLLPFYAQFCLAHLGKESPAQLPFIEEVYEMSQAALLAETGERLSNADRSVTLRFLSTQAERKNIGEGNHEPELSPFQWKVSDTRKQLGKTQDRYEKFLRTQADKMGQNPLERAQIYQRGLSLLHFYTAEILSEHKGKLPKAFDKLSFDPQVLQKVLADSQVQAYPKESIEIFRRFYAELLKQKIPEALPDKVPAEINQSLEALPTHTPPFFEVQKGETWAEYLTRMGLTRGEFNAAELGIAGMTIFNWGSSVDAEGRISVPGDILNLLSVVTYLNARKPGIGVDPFVAARLALPEQLHEFTPNERGEVIIRYPKIMEGLDYEHFGLGALLRAQIASHREAHDMDLARQWGVSESTAAEYRRGVVRKMLMETLDKLADSLAASPEQKNEIKKFLFFLRYRPYFNATLVIEDAQGTPLNSKPPQISQVKIVLMPMTGDLKSVDPTRRVQFEREPFASVINGSVDLALDLLETRKREFEILGLHSTELPDKSLSLADLSKQLQSWRDQHTEYTTTLSEHEQRPGILKPGELQKMQDFYRDFFRNFEAIYLHAHPQSQIQVDGHLIEYEIVAPTTLLPRGARFIHTGTNKFKAHVVAADLIRLGNDLEPATLHTLIKLRILNEYLRQQGYGESSLKALAERVGLVESLETRIEQLEKLELASQSEGAVFVDASENAILHRITRGKNYLSQNEKRKAHWYEDLARYIEQQGMTSLQNQLQGAFARYLEETKQPYKHFEREALERALQTVSTEATEISLLRDHLLQFMKRIGLASSDAPDSKSLSAESMASSLFASYLGQSKNLHPLAISLELREDPILLERIVDDRLTDYPEFKDQRNFILEKIRSKIAAYNQRDPLLKVHELKGEEVREAFEGSLRVKIYEEARAEIQKESGEATPTGSQERILRAYHELRTELAHRDLRPEDFQKYALEPVEIKILEVFCTKTRLLWKAVERIAALTPEYVKQERYLSGLENSSQLGREVQSIFLRYFHSQLFDLHPLSFQQAISTEYESRFGHYENIQQGILRGVQVVFQNLIRHYARQYHEINESIGLAREEAQEHRSLELFWETCIEFGKNLDPQLKTREDLLQGLGDFEHLFRLSSWTLNLDAKANLLKAEAEIKALPILTKAPEEPVIVQTEGKKTEERPLIPIPDPHELLKGVLAPKLLEDYPEILLVSEDQLLATVQDHPTRQTLVSPEGRNLVQLIALLELYSKHGSPEIRGRAEDIILEIVTSSDPLEKATQDAYDMYGKIREELIANIPLLDYLSTLPEIRHGIERAQGSDIYFAIHGQITRRLIPKNLKEEFDRKVQTNLEEGKVLDAEYFSWLAAFYHRNRSVLIAVSPLNVAAQDMKNEMSLELRSARRATLQKDYPELSFAPLESHGNELKLLQSSKMDVFEYNLKGHELFILHALMHRYFGSLESKSAIQKAASEILAEYTRLFALVNTGASIPHVLKEAHDRIFAIYRKNHAEILVHVAQKEGAEKVISLLPEIAALSFNPSEGWKEIPEIEPGFLDSAQTFQKVVWRIQRGSSKSNIQKELEKLLWDFDPTHQGGEDHEVTAASAEMQKNVFLFYLRHRSGLSATPRFHAKSIQDPRNYDSYWELNAFPVESIEERQKTTLGLLSRPLSNEVPIFMQVRNRHGTAYETVIKNSERETFVARLGGGEIIYEAPFTKLHRMYNSALSLMNPKVRALFNEAKSHSAETRRIEMDTYRAMTLLYLGADPAWVMERFQQRVLDYYDQHRSDILARTSFAELAMSFEEIKAVPDYEIDRIVRVFARTGKGNPILSRDNELFIRLYAIVCQNGHDDKAVNEMLRGNPPRDGNLTIEEVNENATRYYLKNMKKIFQTLRPWMVASDANMLQVKYHPLISNILPQDATDMSIAGPRGVDRESPDYNLMTRIVAVVEHPDVPRNIQEEFRRAWNKARPQSTESYTRAMVNFFVANESRIQQAYDRIQARKPLNKP